MDGPIFNPVMVNRINKRKAKKTSGRGVGMMSSTCKYKQSLGIFVQKAMHSHLPGRTPNFSTFLSNPCRRAKRVDVEKRPDGASNTVPSGWSTPPRHGTSAITVQCPEPIPLRQFRTRERQRFPSVFEISVRNRKKI